ncbi:EF-hand domain-containing protein [Thalassolituus sp. LLYu03]|uniref:EF-hand domain-containing protein n=1 Tax=Thalassolituus sp. LLYu03 TaxID=3421656 RepID=UPI003D2680A2
MRTLSLMPLMLASFVSFGLSVTHADNSRPDMPGKAKSFSQLDTDGSGYLTEDEVSDDRFLADKFSELDTNNDGTLTEDELKQPGQGGQDGGKGAGQPPSFSDLDTDGDGEISQDEAASDRFLSEMFDKMDRDGSGTLSEDEMRPPRR